MSVRIIILAAILFVTGCASNPMVIAPDQKLQEPLVDESQVVFMRSSFVGSAISASLYEVTDGDIKFIGVIANGVKLSYKTTPGKHVFMVVSEAADFMEADLTPGKNYFGIATPRMGAWVARFSLWPIKSSPEADFRLNTPEFRKWVDNTQLVENTDKSLAWYEKNKKSIKSKYEKYWPAWENKSAEDVLKRTLSPEDGV